jgi:hypothetical protein
MAKTSIGREVVQEGFLREGLEAAIRERLPEAIELILEEEVDAALGAGRSQRVAEPCGYRHGRKQRRLTLRTGAFDLAVSRGRLVTLDGGEREWHSRLVPRYRWSSAEGEQRTDSQQAAPAARTTSTRTERMQQAAWIRLGRDGG